MIKRIIYNFFFIIIILLTIVQSCKDEEEPIALPIVATLGANNITTSTANSGGIVSEDGGGLVTERGICWDTITNPTVDLLSKTIDGDGVGSYTSSLNNLISGTKYYIRAYAVNEAGTAYGNEVSFNTVNSTAIISTSEISNITSNSATSGGTISHNGGSFIINKGICWGKDKNPVIDKDSITENGNGIEEFISQMLNLDPGCKYYIRAYAINSIGVSYGNEMNFETSKELPNISTKEVSNITSTSVNCGGILNSDGGDEVLETGICWSLSTNPTVENLKIVSNSQDENFDLTITGLEIGTKYYMRAYATNSVGTTYGNEVNFTTIGYATIETNQVSDITKYSFIVDGNIIDNGGSYIIACGICWDINPNPTIELETKTELNGITEIFSTTAYALSPNTKYYVKTYVINEVGVSYGEEISVTTNIIDEGLEIGQEYAGGIIFYLDDSGEHGLVCTTEDQKSVVWGCTEHMIPGTSTIIGSGLQNTIAIVENCDESEFAAKECYDLVFNRYDDWFLPSKDELNLIYLNLYLNDIGNFDDIYRSSSDYDGSSAWTMQFSKGVHYNLWKGSSVGIRAVRAF